MPLSRVQHVGKDFVLNFEAKALRDTRELLDKQNLSEAYAFIEENPHPRLWRLLAEVGLQKGDLGLAEKALVRALVRAGPT